MDFLKKHYEKVLLGAVLLGLAGAVGFLFFKIASEKEALQLKETELTRPNVKPLPPLDLSAYEAVLQRLSTPAILDLSAPHKLFNPMPWRKLPDGRLVKLDPNSVGPKALVVTKLTKLYVELTLDNVSIEETNVPKFTIGIKREAAPKPADRRKTTRYCKAGDKNDLFLVKEFGGPPDSPTNVVLVLNENGEEVVLNTDKTNPYRRVDGYTADLKYAPENRSWTGCRANTPPPLTFNGESYDVVAVNKNEVILKAKSNQKKWSIPYNSPD